jgi:hypothetical protein
VGNLTPVPSDPDELRAWLEQLRTTTGRQDLLAGFDDNVEIELPEAPDTVQELTIKVTLRGTEPPIWRRLVGSGDTTLDAFHEVLQTAMGWTDSHLHRFYPGPDDRGAYFVTDYDQEEGDDGTPEQDVRVDQVLRAPGDRFWYDYDFGDGWTHDVRLESVADVTGDPLPRCTGGARACPPEDVGGIHGYAEVAAWHRAGRPTKAIPEPFESVEQLIDWLPSDFDPDRFEVGDVDLRLQAAAKAQRLIEGLRPELVDLLSQLDPVGSFQAMEWVAAIPDQPPSHEDLTAATQHWRVLLDAVGSGVKLSSAGYLPPAVVQQVFDGLALDQVWPGRGNREDHTPPIARLRSAAQQLGLLRKAKGELAPTAKAVAVATDPAGLLAHVTSRLPLGREQVEQEAGWFALLGLAAGARDRDLYEAVGDLLGSRGWELGDGYALTWSDVHGLARDTVQAVTGPAGLFSWRGGLPAWVQGIAAQVVAGVAVP